MSPLVDRPDQNPSDFPVPLGLDAFPTVARNLYCLARVASRAHTEATKKLAEAEIGYRVNTNFRNTNTASRYRKEAVAARKLVQETQLEAEKAKAAYRAAPLDAVLEKQLELYYLALEAQQAQDVKEKAVARGEADLEETRAQEKAVLEAGKDSLEHQLAMFDEHKRLQRAQLHIEDLKIVAEKAKAAYQAAALDAKGSFRFLDFPAEVRIRIYEYALKSPYGLRCSRVPGNSITRQKRGNFHFRGRHTAALLYTCRQIRSEAIPVALAENVLHFKTWKHAQLVIEQYDLENQARPYDIRVREDLHYYEPEGDDDEKEDDVVDSDYDSEDEFQAIHFTKMVDFCKAHPHLNVTINIWNIHPNDLNFLILDDEDEENEYANSEWYHFLLEWRERNPSSNLRFTFELPEEWWEDWNGSYSDLEKELRHWGEGAVRWPSCMVDESNESDRSDEAGESDESYQSDGVDESDESTNPMIPVYQTS